jgi:hypothetical protein
VGPLGLDNRTIDRYMIYFSVVVLVLALVLEPPVIVKIVPWVGRASFCCGCGCGLASIFA